MDLEKSLGLRSLTVEERSFVSQGARDSYERMVMVQSGGEAAASPAVNKRGRGSLPADVDGLLSASINKWG